MVSRLITSNVKYGIVKLRDTSDQPWAACRSTGYVVTSLYDNTMEALNGNLRR